jgi:hypothetical protein
MAKRTVNTRLSSRYGCRERRAISWSGNEVVLLKQAANGRRCFGSGWEPCRDDGDLTDVSRILKPDF